MVNRIYLIRKNTPELRKCLEDFGFEKNSYMNSYEYEDSSKYLLFTVYEDDMYNPSILTCLTNSTIVQSPVTVDCGTDDVFFLSCAEIYRQ